MTTTTTEDTTSRLVGTNTTQKEKAMQTTTVGYRAEFPGKLGTVTLAAKTLTEAHARLRAVCSEFGFGVSGLTSTLTGGHTEVTGGGTQFGVSILRDQAAVSPACVVEALPPAHTVWGDLADEPVDETVRLPPRRNHRARKRSIHINQMRLI